METRKIHETPFSPIPSDYAKLVNDVFTTNFDAGLKALEKATRGKFHFSATGRIYASEVILCVSLLEENQLAATSVYASCDFDSKASSPTIEDLLSAGVDAAGAVFGELLEPANPRKSKRSHAHADSVARRPARMDRGTHGTLSRVDTRR